MTLTASLATYTRLYLVHSLGPSSSIPGNLLLGSQPDCGPAAEGAIDRSLGYGEREKKRYCYHSRHVLTCPRNTTESDRRKAGVDPHGKNKFPTWRICKSSAHHLGSRSFQGCTYSKRGISVMWGEKVSDTKNYHKCLSLKQTSNFFLPSPLPHQKKRYT
uniref:Uncharacterized protein n=1 Tax=Ursus americanus TaxID=9643 RepID=A0A452SJX2_URSAM